MLDIKAHNEPLILAFTAAYGMAPGMVRDHFPEKAAALIHQAKAAYDGASPQERSAGFSDMASQLRTIGYGVETAAFADLAIKADSSNVPQTLNNQSNQAYALGLINGSYDEALAIYQHVLNALDETDPANATLIIKTPQNIGQILHRIGMAGDKSAYSRALEFYDTADRLIDKSGSLPGTTAQRYHAQIQYARAKTKTHLFRLGEGKIEAALSDAHASIKGLEGLTGVEGDLACFKAVLGDAFAAAGQNGDARAHLSDAYKMQKQMWRLAVPRWASTEFKLAMTNGQPTNAILGNLRAFYGPAGHPDLIYYRQKASSPKPGLGPRGTAPA